MLRPWQSACIEQTYARYCAGQRHAFCQATPGAGKTRMSAELAKQLLTEELVDLVVCFAPSREVVEGFRLTLETVTGRRFDGKLGSAGTALTYQAMDFLTDDFWALFRSHRVLAVFDEIHHCASHSSGESNLWGQLIVQKIQDNASYTLALSGTPWRSDELGIALARYSTPEGRLLCDFRYGLSEAVSDGVCRSPRIVLLDNDNIGVSQEPAQVKQFNSIAGLLKNSSIRYQDLLDNEQALKQVFKMANLKLNELRAKVSDAAGLVVASTIEHASFIATLLEEMGECVIVVTSDSPNARNKIKQFRQSSDRWIIAVGMIAEGTDIPRIQVCCHLSRIRTELHFRQVLGRAIRRIGPLDRKAWMYIFAEPSLTDFAKRVAEDLPDDLGVLVHECSITEDVQSSYSQNACVVDNTFNDYNESNLELTLGNPGAPRVPLSSRGALGFSEHFRHQLLAIF
ncbi:diguanylate cyclase [Thalassolituus sp. HI0120]|nr:diguanylate cyclase [Thalassolituus sp. HI0120]KZZ46934.1 diguanylate cyclase [Thalassolituus sp. HI0120]